MTTQAIERVEQWETRSFEGGYRGLQTLTDREFSGVVRATGGTLCMLNGTVVGIVGGSIDDFEDADGTAYTAPTPALPLLIVMQERSDEVRGKYYTEDTPLSKVDSTLSDGGFTGFIQLSENVLSGDYYVVYHSGRSMSVAFVGESAQLLVEDEAFQRADDEVGIYEVRPVDIEPVEIPEPETPPASSAEAAAGSSDTPAAEDEDSDVPVSADTDAEAANDTAPDDSEPDSADPAETPTDETATPSTVQEPDTTGGQPEAATSDGAVSTERARTDDSTSEPTAESRSETGTDANAAARTEPVAQDSESAAGESAPPETAAESPTTETDPESTTPAETATQERLDGADRRAQGSTAAAESTRPTTETDTDTPERTTTDRPSGDRDQSADTATEGPASSGQSPTADQRRETGTSGADRPADRSPSRSGGSPSSGEAVELETRTLPSLDPDRTWNGDERERQPEVPTGESANLPSTSEPEPANEHRSSGQSEATEASQSTDTATAGTSEKQQPNAAAPPSSESESATEPEPEPQAETETVAALRETIADREQRIETLEANLETTRRERDELETERDDLQAQVERLEDELSELREELSDLREEREMLSSQLEAHDGTDGETPERRLGQQEALDGTDLFVRYASKGEPTLKSAYENGATRADVNQNLDVESHTQFETEGTVVSGDSFESFLHSTVEHRYVSWIVRQLLFEIRDTGHQDALADLYDALPRIDRIELNGTTAVEYTEDGQTKRSQESFDVVLRDRMGNPLIVANINDSRQAATEDQMSSLVTAATRIGESNASLAAAMFVTSSFFEPGALETAADATGGGLLSRDKRESYVKISRKQGFHLCLVEAREEQFHMAVPEL
ncbi:hypothetical protein [Halorhabdus sp. CUG00001]|uniref:DUF7527 domain-containing protein n=1 Tax=Halorhabdus sp. CUG00001 TaxID=2600297 RepID=UPI00131CECA0|nr:hypothetical protein [Halorhabdus sp. CUG00001]